MPLVDFSATVPDGSVSNDSESDYGKSQNKVDSFPHVDMHSSSVNPSLHSQYGTLNILTFHIDHLQAAGQA